jgi:hypothetical protein
MEIDINKITNEVTNNHCETIDSLINARQNIIEALNIMQSTIENFDDKDCLQLNKERMIEYFNKFSK